MRMHRVKSRSVAAVGYAAAKRALRVRFVSGATYDYLRVPEQVFKELLEASSKGQFVNWRIKPVYRFTRLDRA